MLVGSPAEATHGRTAIPKHMKTRIRAIIGRTPSQRRGVRMRGRAAQAGEWLVSRFLPSRVSRQGLKSRLSLTGVEIRVSVSRRLEEDGLAAISPQGISLRKLLVASTAVIFAVGVGWPTVHFVRKWTKKPQAGAIWTCSWWTTAVAHLVKPTAR